MFDVPPNGECVCPFRLFSTWTDFEWSSEIRYTSLKYLGNSPSLSHFIMKNREEKGRDDSVTSHREIHLEKVAQMRMSWAHFLHLSAKWRLLVDGIKENIMVGTFFHRVDGYDNMPAFSPGKNSGKDERAPEVQRLKEVASEMLVKITFWNVSRTRDYFPFHGE